MKTGIDTERPFPSTTWEPKRARVSPAPQARNTGERSDVRRQGWRRFGPWPRERSLTLKVTYRGGPESWWLVEARGASGVFPGHLCLEDVMSAVLSER